jgi:hypothetical protein
MLCGGGEVITASGRCTLAGIDRLLAAKARVGFHSANFSGLDQKVLPEINDEIRKTLSQHGVAPWFIDKALTTEIVSGIRLIMN